MQKLAASLAIALLFASPASAKVWVTKWYPFELKGGHIFVPVTVAGVETRAIFDTGASVHMLDRAFAEAHGIPFSLGGAVEVQAGHSRDRLPVAYRVPIELFGAGVKLKVVPVSDVPFADLLIGTSVLASFVMQIDYANSRIRFASHEASKLAEIENLEMRRSGSGLPAVRATLDGEDVWLLLDTGLSGPLLLEPRFVRRRGWPEDVGTLSIDALGAVRGMTRHKVPLLQLGPYDLRGVVADVPAEGKLPALLVAGADGRVSLTGVLGAEVLRHFMVTIDLKHMRIHLAHSEKLESESWEWSGSTEEPPPEPAPDAPPED
jgi:predicted aspartyl protease